MCGDPQAALATCSRRVAITLRREVSERGRPVAIAALALWPCPERPLHVGHRPPPHASSVTRNPCQVGDGFVPDACRSPHGAVEHRGTPTRPAPRTGAGPRPQACRSARRRRRPSRSVRTTPRCPAPSTSSDRHPPSPSRAFARRRAPRRARRNRPPRAARPRSGRPGTGVVRRAAGRPWFGGSHSRAPP